MNAKDRREKCAEFLEAHWGDLSKAPFEVHAEKYFGDGDNFAGLVDMATIAASIYLDGGAELKPLASLLMSAIKTAYDLGRESMLQ